MIFMGRTFRPFFIATKCVIIKIILYQLTIYDILVNYMDTIFKLRNFLFSFIHMVNRSLEEELGIALPQFMILVAVSNNPLGTQAVLAEFRKITPAGVSKQMSVLLKKKLIIRKNNKNDKRERAITLTEKGKKTFKRSMDIFKRHQNEVFKGVPKGSIRQMNDTLDKLLVSTSSDFMHICKKKK